MAGRLNYVELPVGNTAGSRMFFEQAFGWSLTAFGPDYAATTGAGGNGGCDIALNGDSGDATKAPLAAIETDDLEAALASVEGAAD